VVDEFLGFADADRAPAVGVPEPAQVRLVDRDDEAVARLAALPFDLPPLVQGGRGAGAVVLLRRDDQPAGPRRPAAVMASGFCCAWPDRPAAT
jgi:hypothetical protein